MHDINGVNKYFSQYVDCILDDCSYKPDLVEQSLKEFSDEEWLEVIQNTNPQFIEYDIISGPFDVDPNKKNLVYLSNIFAYNFLIHKMKIKDIHDKFNEYLQLPNTVVYGKNVFKDSVCT
jgi:hypothetical protein